MNFGTAIKTAFTKYAVFRGVATRPEYWWFVLFTVIVSSVINLFMGDPNNPNPVASGLSLLFSLGTLIPSLSISVRRFHDAGFSGKWLLLYLVPIVLFVVAAASTFPVFFAAIQGNLMGDELTAALVGLVGVAALPLITGLAIVVFNLVLTLLPSKSAVQGNKYAA